MRAFITALLCVSMSVSASIPSRAQTTQGSDIDDEAKHEISEIDCSITKLSVDAENFRRQLAPQLEFVTKKVKAAYATSAELRKQAVEVRADSLLTMPDEAMEGMVENSAEAWVERYAATEVPKKVLIVVSGLWTYYGIIEKFHQMRKLVLATVDDVAARHELLYAMDNLDMISGQLKSAEGAVQALLDRRATMLRIWRSKGAEIPENFFGEDCDAEDKGFNGRWFSNNDPTQTEITVTGNQFALQYRTPGHDICGVLKGSFKFVGTDEIHGKFKDKCDDLKAVGEFTMKRESGKYSLSTCIEVSYAGDKPRCNVQFQSVQRQ
jgi:hypothetical protein